MPYAIMEQGTDTESAVSTAKATLEVQPPQEVNANIDMKDVLRSSGKSINALSLKCK